jgi:hypothetical protein
MKACHPGPCNVPCSPACAGRPVIPPTPTGWDRFCARAHERRAGSVRKPVFSFSLLVIIYTLLGVMLYFHIEWWAKPFKYPGFSAGAGMTEHMVIAMVEVMIVLPVVSVLLLLLYMGIISFLILVLNLDSRETNPGRKAATKFFSSLILFLICLGIWILPIVG